MFLPLVALCYWVCPPRFRVGLLVAASYYFYMHAFRIYGLLLLGLTACNYGLGLAVARAATDKIKRLLLVAGIAFNLGMLALFKYTNLLLDTFNSALAHLGSWTHVAALHSTGIADLPIILPLGISFFVFEFIHYLTDVFKGSKPVKNPLRFALFASFFPSQIAGPIKRYQDFDKQLDKPATISSDNIYAGLWLIAQGLFKKVCLGDNLSPIVQAGFKNPELLSTGDAWLASLAFAFQIYYDFSGYTDIGRGSAMLFGFSLPENFNMPYLSTSLKEFWRRWHISLSSWLRDYLYVPLGGSRKGEASTMANLFTTMLLGGLWHGASWTFLLWGAFHGAGLAVNRVFDQFLAKHPAIKSACDSTPGKAIAYVVTMVTVLVGWVLFYAHNLPQALGVLKAMFSPQTGSVDCMVTHQILQSSILPAVAMYMIVVAGIKLQKVAAKAKNTGDNTAKDLSPIISDSATPVVLSPVSNIAPPRVVLHACALAAVFVITLELAPRLQSPFIYFQF